MHPTLNFQMKRALESTRLMLGAISNLEVAFDVWLNNFLLIQKDQFKLNQINTYGDLMFNLDGHKPTVVSTLGYSDLEQSMLTVGLDFIKPASEYITGSDYFEDDDDEDESFEDLLPGSMADELKNTTWILITVIEVDHPLKGLRYVTSLVEDQIVLPFCDPTFTNTYTDEQIYPMHTGFFIDADEILFKAINGDLFK